MKRRLAYEICYAIAALWALPQAAKAAGIATVVDVVNEGYRQPPGADELTAKVADELVQNEKLRTRQESTIAVQFVDGSALSVEQSSEMVLSDYVFNGSAASGLIDLNNGLFHFTSNGKPDQDIKLRTPVATIGIRGTEFLVHVDGDDATIIDILDGSVEAAPRGAGKAATCGGGQSILIAGADQDAQCGDIGSFSTAAGPASSEPDNPEPGHGGQNEQAARAVPADRPSSDPDETPSGGGEDPGGEDPGSGEDGEGKGEHDHGHDHDHGEGGHGGGEGEGGHGHGHDHGEGSHGGGEGEGGHGGGGGEGEGGHGGGGEAGHGEGGESGHGEGGEGEGGEGGHGKAGRGEGSEGEGGHGEGGKDGHGEGGKGGHGEGGKDGHAEGGKDGRGEGGEGGHGEGGEGEGGGRGKGGERGGS